MARRACGFVAGVTENDEIGEHEDRFFGCDFRRQVEFGVAGLAFFGVRKSRSLGGFGCRVAGDALQFQGRVDRVAELDYGSEKATSESEKLRSYLLPPPAAMTTNCLPDFPINVIGLAKALAGRRVSQSSFPVVLSNARKRR
jgi:hypothetical protein